MMRKILLAAFCWIALLGTAWGQTQPASLPLPGSVSAALRQLLPPRQAQVTIMDSLVVNPRLQELLTEFQQGLKANPQYMLDMQKRVATQGPGPLAYDKRVGMSEPEFREFQALMEKRDMKVAPSYTGTVTTREENGSIHFTGTGRLRVLNEVWIDLIKNEVHFSTYTLPYRKEVAVADARNAFDSAWTAYEWELTRPAGETFENLSLDKLKALDMLLLQVQVGKLAKTGKTFLKVKGTQIDKGVKKFAFDRPLFFD